MPKKDKAKPTVHQPRQPIAWLAPLLALWLLCALYLASPALWVGFWLVLCAVVFDGALFLRLRTQVSVQQYLSHRTVACFGALFLHVSLRFVQNAARHYHCVLGYRDGDDAGLCYRPLSQIDTFFLPQDRQKSHAEGYARRFAHNTVTARLTLPVVPQYIGRHAFGVERLYIKSMLGLFVRCVRLAPDDEEGLRCLVLPAERTLDVPVRVLPPRLLRDGQRFMHEEGQQYLGNRPYQPGDRLRHIDFKRSAARQTLLVRDLSAPTPGPAAQLVLPPCSAAQYQQVAEGARALARYLCDCGATLLFVDGLHEHVTPYTAAQLGQLYVDLALHVPRAPREDDVLSVPLRDLPCGVVLCDAQRLESQYHPLLHLPGHSVVLLLDEAEGARDALQAHGGDPHRAPLTVCTAAQLGGDENDGEEAAYAQPTG